MLEYLFGASTVSSIQSLLASLVFLAPFTTMLLQVAVGWSGYAQALFADMGVRLPAALASAPVM
jgi:APA family basic amino acid/polyamine antiporter